MSTPIVPKRSDVPGRLPTLADLVEGEIAINTADGIIYQRQGTSIVVVGTAIRNGAVKMGNNFLRPKLGASGRTWEIANASGEIPVVNGDFLGYDTLRWGDSSTKSMLVIPSTIVAFGRYDLGSKLSMLHSGNLTTDRTFYFPDKDGILATIEDIPDPPYLPPVAGFIEGFEVLSTDIDVTFGPGRAEIGGTIVEYAGGTVGGARSPNITYHYYLTPTGSIIKLSSGFGPVYAMTARKHSTQLGYRWLFSTRTDASANMPRLRATGGSVVDVRYLQNTGLPPLALVIAQNYSTPTDVSMASLGAPAGPTRDAVVRLAYGGNGLVSRIYAYQGIPGTTNGTWEILSNVMAPQGVNTVEVAVDGAPKFRVDGGSVTVNLLGYRYCR